MLTLIPLPEAKGFSSGIDLTLLITLFADDLADERCDSTSAGRGPFMDASEPPTEFLGLDRISPVAHDHLLLSGGDVSEPRRLLKEERGVGESVVLLRGDAKCVSIKERKKRFALSRGPASFSRMYEVLLL